MRFTPAEVGAYGYSGAIVGPSGSKDFSGTFVSVPSSNHGFIRRAPGSRDKLEFADGTFAALTGLNDCWTSRLGGFIGANNDPGPEPSTEIGSVNLDTYFSKYGDGEGLFNVFRWTPIGGCEFSIYDSLGSDSTFSVANGKLGDQILAAAKAHGFHVMLTFFGGSAPWADAPTNPSNAAAMERVLRYVISRYGAYVDIWELTNESDSTSAPPSWVSFTANLVRRIDPYHRIVTNSNPQTTDRDSLDMQSPHVYSETYDLYNVYNLKSRGIPIVAGEVGFGANDPCVIPDDFMRISSWTAVMGRVGAVYWNSSFKYVYCQNMYIGYKQRIFNQILQQVVAGLDPSADSSIVIQPTGGRAAYALASRDEVIVYIRRSPGQPPVAKTDTITVNIPFQSGNGQWIAPATGRVIATLTVNGGTNQYTTPVYYDNDIAFKAVTASIARSTPVVRVLPRSG